MSRDKSHRSLPHTQRFDRGTAALCGSPGWAWRKMRKTKRATVRCEDGSPFSVRKKETQVQPSPVRQALQVMGHASNSSTEEEVLPPRFACLHSKECSILISSIQMIVNRLGCAGVCLKKMLVFKGVVFGCVVIGKESVGPTETFCSRKRGKTGASRHAMCKAGNHRMLTWVTGISGVAATRGSLLLVSVRRSAG